MKLKSKITALIYAILLVMTLSPALVLADCTNPATAKEAIQCGADNGSGNANKSPAGLDTTATHILNILSTVVGVAAVIMIIISGLRYIMSGGDAEKVKTAKRTLLYAIVGLLIVALTQTIVHLVLTEASTPAKPSVMFRSISLP